MPAQLTERARFARFIITGGTAAAVNIGARWALNFLFIYEVSVALSYVAGMITAFVLARLFVFEHSGDPLHGQFTRFALVNVIAFVQVWLVSVGLARLIFPAITFTSHAETVAHVIGVFSPLATSYFLHKRFSFRAVRS